MTYKHRIPLAREPLLEQGAMSREWYKWSSGIDDDVTLFRGAVYNVKDRRFGAKGDGVTDDTAAIQSAITAGDVVYFPPGAYKVSTTLVLHDGSSLLGGGDGNTLLDFSAATYDSTSAAIRASGTLVALPALAANIVADTQTITFASAPDLDVGDIIQIRDSADSSYNASRVYYRAGEIVRVASVSGVTVTTESSFYASYSSGSTVSAYKVEPVSVSVKGLRAEFKPDGGGNAIGIYLSYGYNVGIADLVLTGADYGQISLNNCYCCSVSSVRAQDFAAASGTNYAIVITNSQRIAIADCILCAPRHAVAVGGTGTGGPVNREIIISNSVLSTIGSAYAADFHGNCEFCAYDGNTIIGGVHISGDHITVANNIISAWPSNGVGIYINELRGSDISLRNNSIRAVADTDTNLGLISFGYATLANMVRGGTLGIVDNAFFAGTYLLSCIRILNSSTSQVINIDIGNNYIGSESVVANSNRWGVRISGDNQLGFGRIDIHDNRRMLAINLTAVCTNEIYIDRNVVESTREGIRLATAALYGTAQTKQLVVVSGNRVIAPDRTCISLRGDQDGSLTTMVVEGNFAINPCQGGTTGSSETNSSLYADKATLVVSRNNVFGKEAADGGAAQRTAYYSNIATLFESDNVNVGTLVSASLAVTNRYSRYTYDATNREWFGTDPTGVAAGARGDRVWATAPATAQPPGWVCVTAGSPGTWKAMANLA